MLRREPELPSTRVPEHPEAEARSDGRIVLQTPHPLDTHRRDVHVSEDVFAREVHPKAEDMHANHYAIDSGVHRQPTLWLWSRRITVEAAELVSHQAPILPVLVPASVRTHPANATWVAPLLRWTKHPGDLWATGHELINLADGEAEVFVESNVLRIR